MFFNILNVCNTCAFIGVGRPGSHCRAVAASAVVILIAIYPACKLLGVVGGQVAALLAVIVSYLFQVMRMRELTDLDLFRYAKAFAPAALVRGGFLSPGLAPASSGWRLGRCLTSFSARAPVLPPMLFACQPL